MGVIVMTSWDRPYGKWSVWRLVCKMQRKVISLTYIPVKIIYLPWQVSNHGSKNQEKSQICQNVPENIPIWALPSIRVMQLKIDWKNKHRKFLQKIFNFGHKYTSYLIFGSLLHCWFEKKCSGEKSSFVKIGAIDHQTSPNLLGKLLIHHCHQFFPLIG